MKLIDFFKWFPDEQSCKDALKEQRQMSGIACRDEKRKGDNLLKRSRGSAKRSPGLVMAETDKGTETRKGLIWVHIAISNAKRNLLNNFHHVTDTYL